VSGQGKRTEKKDDISYSSLSLPDTTHLPRCLGYHYHYSLSQAKLTYSEHTPSSSYSLRHSQRQSREQEASRRRGIDEHSVGRESASE
jgi:hypothetical protein